MAAALCRKQLGLRNLYTSLAYGLPAHCRRSASNVSAPATKARDNLQKFNLGSPKNDYITWTGPNGAPLPLESRFEYEDNDLVVYPSFMSELEQQILLSSALKKLDSMSSSSERKKRREWLRANGTKGTNTELNSFLPDELYTFEDTHFDSVISGYRECTLSQWAPFKDSELNKILASVLERAYSIVPERRKEQRPHDPLQTPSDLICHLLHLSSSGYILPHRDNIDASAGTIIGLCLGSERNLVLTHRAGDAAQQVRVRLPPGCAYMQTGIIRYDWNHEIAPADPTNPAHKGQRLSVMIRDRLEEDSEEAEP